MTARSGICPVCGRTIRLKVDGTVFHHRTPKNHPTSKNRTRWPYARPDCRGTNQTPKPESETC